MSLQPLNPKPNRIVGLDLSSNSIAYSLFVDKELKQFGELDMTGTTEHRLYQANRYAKELGDILKPDLIAYESAVYLQNKKTVIILAMFFGAVISAMSKPTTTTQAYIPTQWQYFLGNMALTKKEKNDIKLATPGKSASWYKNTEREFRKQRTMNWANEKFGINVTSDNVSDAIGVGWMAINNG